MEGGKEAGGGKEERRKERDHVMTSNHTIHAHAHAHELALAHAHRPGRSWIAKARERWPGTEVRGKLVCGPGEATALIVEQPRALPVGPSP
jgi:hypothetical protein